MKPYMPRGPAKPQLLRYFAYQGERLVATYQEGGRLKSGETLQSKSGITMSVRLLCITASSLHEVVPKWAGPGDRIRTCDPMIPDHVLYQLSHTRLSFAANSFTAVPVNQIIDVFEHLYTS